MQFRMLEILIVMVVTVLIAVAVIKVLMKPEKKD
jgi:hypothetical protein